MPFPESHESRRKRQIGTTSMLPFGLSMHHNRQHFFPEPAPNRLETVH